MSQLPILNQIEGLIDLVGEVNDLIEEWFEMRLRVFEL